jgi:uncharacterized protein RhaS with RHS repeats
VTSFQYQGTGPAAALTTVTGPTGCKTVYGYVPGQTTTPSVTWLLNSITDPNGYRTTYTYDNNNRITQRYVAAGGALTQYAYGMTTAGTYMQTTDALGEVSVITLGVDRCVSVTANALGNLTTDGAVELAARTNAEYARGGYDEHVYGSMATPEQHHGRAGPGDHQQLRCLQ